MIEPLPTALRHLVASETAAPVTTHAAQAAVRAKLGTTLGIATAATAATTAAGTTAATAGTATGTVATGTTVAAGGVAIKSALAIKLLAVVLTVGTGAVVTTVAVTRDREPAKQAVERPKSATPSPRPAPTKPTTKIVVEPIEDVPAAPAEVPIAEPPKQHVAPRAVVEPAPTAEPAPARTQSQLLADATRSLSLGDAARALELIDEDTLAHPAGALVEEREALRISALTALGRTVEAKDAARSLLAAYPHSIHRRLAERVLAEETP